MSVLTVLDELGRAGVELAAEGENLPYRGPKRSISPTVREELVENKAEILDFLRKAGVNGIRKVFWQTGKPFVFEDSVGCLWRYMHAWDRCWPVVIGTRAGR